MSPQLSTIWVYYETSSIYEYTQKYSHKTQKNATPYCCGPLIISKLWLVLHPIRLTCPASNHKTCWAIFWASIDRNGGIWLTYDHSPTRRVSPPDFAQIGPSLEKFRRFGIATPKHCPLRRNRGTALVYCLLSSTYWLFKGETLSSSTNQWKKDLYAP